MPLELQIITPLELVLQQTVESVAVPGALGEMEVLPQHTPIISTLKAGIMHYTTTAGKQESMFIDDGYMQVIENQVLIASRSALHTEAIDEANIEEAIAHAQEALKAREHMTTEEQERFEAELNKQIILLTFKRKRTSLQG